MREKRGKSVETNPENNNDNYSSSSYQIPCKKHPSPSSSVGICAYCLKERLVKLVCSDCGEQRLSSCSCSDVSSYRNSSATDVGSVGRISFLIENERKMPPRGVKSEEVGVLLKRSSSSCVGGKRSGGIWRIARFFRGRRREKGFSERRSVGGGGGSGIDDDGDRNELWVFDYMGGVSRSRSLCSFRGGSFHEESSSGFGFSSAKVSDFNGNSGVDSERPSGFSEKSDGALNGTKRGAFPLKECDFSGMDESGFIDLKLDLETESKADYSVLKSSDFPVLVGGFGGSCRITGDDKGLKKEKRGYKGWRWIFRHHPNWRSASKKDEIHVLRA